MRRLLLGCGSFGHTLLSAASDLDGQVRVLDPDPGRVEALRNEKVPTERADVTDPAAIAGYEADVVVVAGDDAGRNRAAVTAAREAYPDAFVVGYPGEDAAPDARRAIQAAVDRLVSPGAFVIDHVEALAADGDAGRARSLRRALQAVDGKLGVFMHDNPDPDAIASAVALVRIAERLGVDADACYFGEISHQENRAFVNLLDLELRNLDPGADLGEFDGIALVDHSRPGVNDQLDPDTPVDVVVDHHPTVGDVDAAFVDLRDAVGATSTLLAHYLKYFGMNVDSAVATGLLYGIRVDTKDFVRDISVTDFEAAAYLLEYADTAVLERVESPSMSADTLDTIARAIERRTLDGSALASCVGPIGDRDALAQAADRLLTIEGVTTTLVCGFIEGTIYVSARSRRSDLDLGEALRAAFDGMGSAGGHVDMAGAQIPLGLFAELEQSDDVPLADIVEDVVARRFFETLRSDVAHIQSDDAPRAEDAAGTGLDGDETAGDDGDETAGDDATGAGSGVGGGNAADADPSGDGPAEGAGDGDTGERERGGRDAGGGDAGRGDAGGEDAGKGDAGRGDAGRGDAGRGDAESRTAGVEDGE